MNKYLSTSPVFFCQAGVQANMLSDHFLGRTQGGKKGEWLAGMKEEGWGEADIVVFVIYTQ